MTDMLKELAETKYEPMTAEDIAEQAHFVLMELEYFEPEEAITILRKAIADIETANGLPRSGA